MLTRGGENYPSINLIYANTWGMRTIHQSHRQYSPEIMSVDAENGIADMEPAGQISRHAGEDLGDEYRHLVLHTTCHIMRL